MSEREKDPALRLAKCDQTLIIFALKKFIASQ